MKFKITKPDFSLKASNGNQQNPKIPALELAGEGPPRPPGYGVKTTFQDPSGGGGSSMNFGPLTKILFFAGVKTSNHRSQKTVPILDTKVDMVEKTRKKSKDRASLSPRNERLALKKLNTPSYLIKTFLV